MSANAGRWTEEDVARHEEKLRARRQSSDIQPSSAPQDVPDAQKTKYRAIPCIVTSDGTLFTKPDIEQAEAISEHPLKGIGSLADRAARVGVVGRWFGSLKEARRCVALMQLERAGMIAELELQVRFELSIMRLDGEVIRLGEYRADFRYRDMQNTPHIVVEKVIEDTKGMRTPLYRWKKAHFEAQYGLTILEG